MPIFLITLVFLLVIGIPRSLAEECYCAVTLIAEIGADAIGIRDIYGLPHMCSHGSYSVYQEKRIVRLRWIQIDRIHIVDIPLPKFPIVGMFQVYYCWGDSLSVVGNDLVGVTLVTELIYMVKEEADYVED